MSAIMNKQTANTGNNNYNSKNKKGKCPPNINPGCWCYNPYNGGWQYYFYYSPRVVGELHPNRELVGRRRVVEDGKNGQSYYENTFVVRANPWEHHIYLSYDKIPKAPEEMVVLQREAPAHACA